MGDRFDNRWLEGTSRASEHPVIAPAVLDVQRASVPRRPNRQRGFHRIEEEVDTHGPVVACPQCGQRYRDDPARRESFECGRCGRTIPVVAQAVTHRQPVASLDPGRRLRARPPDAPLRSHPSHSGFSPRPSPRARIRVEPGKKMKPWELVAGSLFVFGCLVGGVAGPNVLMLILGSLGVLGIITELSKSG